MKTRKVLDQHNECTMSISPYYMSPTTSPTTLSFYQKISPDRKTYLAYVVAIRDPLNFHLDIYWPSSTANKYSSAIHYDYTFISEELEKQKYCRIAYSCHMRGVEIISSDDDFGNMKEAYVIVSKRILRSGGWVLVSVSDIDVYRRILVNIFDVVTRKSLNQELLDKKSDLTEENIAREYTRRGKSKNMFHPTDVVPKDYHIVFKSTK